ncbi:hypothetical protein QTP88_020293 [Uroleucon formosanum]
MSLSNNDEIRISVLNMDSYTLPCESYIYIEGKVNKPSDAAGDVRFSNNGLAFLFSEMRYEINGIEIQKLKSPGVSSCLKAYCSYTPNDLNALENAAWDSAMDSEDNKNFMSNNVFTGCIPLKHLFGFCEDYKKILLNCNQQLILNRASTDLDAIHVVGAGATAVVDKNKKITIELTKVLWKMPIIKVSDKEKLRLLKVIDSHRTLSCAFRTWDVCEYPILPRNTSHSWTVKSSSLLEKPRFVLFGLQTDRKKNNEVDAGRFDHCQLKNLKVHLNSEVYPYEDFRADFKNNTTSILYKAYTDFQKSYYERDYSEPLLSKHIFQNYVPIVVVDLSRQNDNVKSSTVDLRIEFETDTVIPEKTAAYCLILHDQIITYNPFSGDVRKFNSHHEDEDEDDNDHHFLDERLEIANGTDGEEEEIHEDLWEMLNLMESDLAYYAQIDWGNRHTMVTELWLEIMRHFEYLNLEQTVALLLFRGSNYIEYVDCDIEGDTGQISRAENVTYLGASSTPTEVRDVIMVYSQAEVLLQLKFEYNLLSRDEDEIEEFHIKIEMITSAWEMPTNVSHDVIIRVSKVGKAKNYVLEFPNEHFQSDGEILYCSACEKSVSIEQRFLVVQHIGTAKHKESKIRRQKFKQQFFTSASTSSGNKNSFNSELCRAFIHADIPISKLENESLNAFLTKYTGQLIPDESTLRKNNMTEIYQETLNSIRNIIQDGPIWVSINETVDVEGRMVGNVIVGKLSETFSKPFLLNCTQLEKCNHKTIAKLFNDSMSLLWPKGVKHENVLLFLTDAAEV